MLPDLIREIRTLRAKAGIDHPKDLSILFDRGGYKGERFAQLMADEHLQFLAMACAYAKSVRQWEAIPQEAFTPCELPIVAKDSSAQALPLQAASTTTTIEGCPTPIPTIVFRDDTPNTKQRWRALFYKRNQPLPPQEAFTEYHARQAHELAYRTLRSDLSGDVLPKAYHLERTENEKGQKRRTVAAVSTPQAQHAVKLIAWIRGLTHNLVRDFGKELGGAYAKMTPGTLIRKFIQRPGRILLTEDTLHVVMEPFQEADALRPFLDKMNAKPVTIPWLGHRRLRISVAEHAMGTVEDVARLKQLISANPKPQTASQGN